MNKKEILNEIANRIKDFDNVEPCCHGIQKEDVYKILKEMERK